MAKRMVELRGSEKAIRLACKDLPKARILHRTLNSLFVSWDKHSLPQKVARDFKLKMRFINELPKELN